MTGDELYSKLNYQGMEEDVRKLAIKDHPDMIEKIAVMTTSHVCDLVARDYEQLYAESEEIGLVKIADVSKVKDFIAVIQR